jgi:hypothetical protein
MALAKVAPLGRVGRPWTVDRSDQRAESSTHNLTSVHQTVIDIPMSLEAIQEELAFFEQKRAELVKTHLGKFALVKGHALIDTFSTFSEAYLKGVELFGPEPFLVKLIVPEDPTLAIPVLNPHLLSA